MWSNIVSDINSTLDACFFVLVFYLKYHRRLVYKHCKHSRDTVKTVVCIVPFFWSCFFKCILDRNVTVLLALAPFLQKQTYWLFYMDYCL